MDTGLKQVCILGLAFFFLFGAYNTLQNLLTTLLTDNNEGFVSLAVLYTSVAPSLVVAPWLTRRAGAKATLLLGVVGYAAYFGALLTRVPWLVEGPASVVIGFGAAILWVAQGEVLTLCCADEGQRGLYSGVFWGIFQLSGVVGNYAAWRVLARSNTAGSGAGGDDAQQLPSSAKTELYVGALLLSGCAAATVALLLRPPSGASAHGDAHGSAAAGGGSGFGAAPSAASGGGGTWAQVRASFVRFKRHFWRAEARPLWWLVPAMFFTGFELSFVTGEWPKAFAPRAGQQSSIPLVFVFWGVGEVLGSLVLGRVSDAIGRRPAFVAGAAAYATALGLTFTFYETGAPVAAGGGGGGSAGEWHGVANVAYGCAFLFGITDCLVNTQVYATLGRLCPTSEASVGAMAVFQLAQNVGSAVMYYAPAALDDAGSTANVRAFMILHLVAAGVAAATFCCVRQERIPPPKGGMGDAAEGLLAAASEDAAAAGGGYGSVNVGADGADHLLPIAGDGGVGGPDALNPLRRALLEANEKALRHEGVRLEDGSPQRASLHSSF